MLRSFYLCHGRYDQWIRAEAMSDNAVCDNADYRYVNATAAGQVLVEHDHGEHDTGETPVPEAAHEQFFCLGF